METYQELRDLLKKLRSAGVKPSTIADRAGVSRACLSQFMTTDAKKLQADTFLRLRTIAEVDKRRLRLE